MLFFDPEYFLFKHPLYSVLEITQENHKEFITLMNFKGRIDQYNPLLKDNTTFDCISWPGQSKNYLDYISTYQGVTCFQLKCVRTLEYYHVFVKVIGKGKLGFIEKVGQTPSIADIEIGQVKNYNKVLSKSNLNEFTKSIGLAAHGVGIGSFVYLRRIFESLIHEAHKKASEKQHWDEDLYQKSRMTEKIELLKSLLPIFLVENRLLYGILSKGIHELSEEECLKNFEIVKVGIELILDEKLEAYNKQQKVEEAKKKLNVLGTSLNTNNRT